MRIAILNQREGGGATAHALDLQALAQRRGFEVSYHPKEGDADAGGLERRLGELEPDVVHAHCFYNAWPPETLARVAASWPVAFTLHDVYAVNQYGTECWSCDHNPWCWACPALPLPKRLYSVYRVRSRRAREKAWRALLAHVVYPTEWMRRRVGRTALARLDGSVIPYGIDTGAFAPDPRAKERLGWDPRAPLLLTVGSMYSPDDDRKGFAVLLDAFARIVKKEVPAARLVIIGRTYGLPEADGVVVKSDLDRRELAVWYAAADVFTLPSLGDHAPLAILEAMAAGAPVVASSVGGIPEQVDSGATGLLVPPRDATLLGTALVRLLRDPSLRKAMGDGGRRRALDRFDRERAWAAHEALYARLSERRRKPAGAWPAPGS
jgi:glycosyltransferase involved in cell wall biosynthesis